MNTTNRHGSAVITLPADREIVITRHFDAPPALVFRAWTTPELVRRWWGFDSSVWKVCDIDLRVLGTWRYVTHEHGGEAGGESSKDGGFDVAFHGEFFEIDAPSRIISTEVFEGIDGMGAGGSLNVATFDERDGGTTMTITVLHATQKGRDAQIASGMEGGMQVSFDRLEDLVVDGAAD